MSALQLLRIVQTCRQIGILRCESRGAIVGIALQRLNVAQRQHHGTSRCRHVCTQRQSPDDVETGENLAARIDANVLTKIKGNESVADEGETVTHG